MSNVCVIGGGFTGLTAAYELASAGYNVTVLEKDDEIGGLAGSFRVGDQSLEKFYHHWFTNDVHIMDLVRRLGVEDHILLRESRTGMYYANNFFKLSSPTDVLKFTPLSLPNRIRLGLGVLKARKVEHWTQLESITAKEWLIELFGRKVYDVVWEPLLIGKFGDVFPQISAVWFWNKLKLRGGSRGKGGAENLAYYRGGFAALAERVAAEVRKLGGSIQTQTQATALENRAGVVTAVRTNRGVVETDCALITTPLPVAADLLQPVTSTSYADSLRRIRYLSNVCLVLELDRSLSDLYWMNVNDPSFPFVGIIEHTNFEPTSTYGGRHIVYLSKYLPPDAELYRMSNPQLFDFSVAAIRRMFPSFSRDWVKDYHVWRADFSQPIIEKRYSSLIPSAETPLANVFLSTMAQVYPEDRGTNYAVRGGLEAARLVKAKLPVEIPASV